MWILRIFDARDAHEFLNFLLNELADILEKELNDVKGSPETSSPSEKNGNGLQNSPVNGVKEEPQMTWVHKSFQINLACFLNGILSFNILTSNADRNIIFVSFIQALHLILDT
ncbi:hypothetical protein Taro_001455 [Colocasia esculenta]|uniref:Uncharacterized protein n=1 Tax=Colocasia esculenta TaxID=4460 RepID=A0A843TEL9_COLES|nr:hypothetical protein [Colocasia esculenta]